MPFLAHDDGTLTDLSALGDQEFLNVGSAASCDIRLTGDGISARHARIVNIKGQIYVQRVSAKRPIQVNDEPLLGDERFLIGGDRIGIGSRTMHYRPTLGWDEGEEGAQGAARAVPLGPKERLKRKIHAILLERIDLKSIESSGRASRELRLRAESVLSTVMDELGDEVTAVGSRDDLYKEVLDDVLGYGPLEDLIADDDITEIMCNGSQRIYVEKRGKLSLTESRFRDDTHLLTVIEKIVSPLGRRIDESSPIVDARLPDGSRVNAVINPVSLDGPTLNVRKFSARPLGIDDIIGFGSMNRAMGDFLRTAVAHRQNVIISGGTGSGKTTLLNVVSSFIPAGERIVTIEDSAELRLEQDHVVRMESRPPNIEGKGRIAIRDLVINSLRMRPDRIVVGECRGGEALDMLQAMNTGHDGSLTTVHANSPHDVISRLETMVLMSGIELPARAVMKQIAAAVNIICHQSRFSDGSRKVVDIVELTGLEGDEIAMQSIFTFRQTGFDGDGNVTGSYEPTGVTPNFVKTLLERGVETDTSIFSGGRESP